MLIPLTGSTSHITGSGAGIHRARTHTISDAGVPSAASSSSSRSLTGQHAPLITRSATVSSSHPASRGHSHAPNGDAPVLTHSRSGNELNHIPKDEDLGLSPPYAAKAVWGQRYTMEDTWAAVPNLLQVNEETHRSKSGRCCAWLSRCDSTITLAVTVV